MSLHSNQACVEAQQESPELPPEEGGGTQPVPQRSFQRSVLLRAVVPFLSDPVQRADLVGGKLCFLGHRPYFESKKVI